MSASNIKAVIEQLRKDLEDDEMAYREAMEVLGNVDKLKEWLKGLSVKLAPLMMYDPDQQPPHSAVAVVARTQERVAGVFDDLQFVEEYEQRKEEYKAALKTHVGLDDEPEDTE
jgi:hypothetical protein